MRAVRCVFGGFPGSDRCFLLFLPVGLMDVMSVFKVSSTDKSDQSCRCTLRHPKGPLVYFFDLWTMTKPTKSHLKVKQTKSKPNKQARKQRMLQRVHHFASSMGIYQ